MKFGTLIKSGSLIVGAAALSSLSAGMVLTASSAPLTPQSGVASSSALSNAALPASVTASVPSMPSAGSSLQEWADWSKADASWAKSLPLASALSAQGRHLVQYSLIPDVPVYGAPAGVTQTAIAGVIAPASTSDPLTTLPGQPHSGQQSAIQPTSPTIAATDPSTCAEVTGPGDDCISADDSTITASYTYLGSGSITGHVESGGGGCPGNAGLETPNVALSYGKEAFVAFNVDASNTWSSRFWKYNFGTNYTLWGTVCAEY